MAWTSLVAQCLQCGRPGLIPGLGRSLAEGKRQPTPVFWPGESHGQRSLAGYSPWGRKDSDTAERPSTGELWNKEPRWWNPGNLEETDWKRKQRHADSSGTLATAPGLHHPDPICYLIRERNIPMSWMAATELWKQVLVVSPPISTKRMEDLGGARLRLGWLSSLKAPGSHLYPQQSCFPRDPGRWGPAHLCLRCLILICSVVQGKGPVISLHRRNPLLCLI